MIPSNDNIYECPKCGHYLRNGALASGNTSRGTVYSDGKSIYPMLPDYPDLTKCKKCDNIFWLNDLVKIGEDDCAWWEKSNSKWANVEYAEFLGIKDLFRALEISKPEKEKNIRIWIWWAFNDRIRDGGKELFIGRCPKLSDLVNFKPRIKNIFSHITLFFKRFVTPSFIEVDDKDLWEQNCKALLNMLGTDNIHEKFMKIELYRNLGEFEKCIDLIESINVSDVEKKDLEWIIDLIFQLLFQAEKKDSLVFITSKW